MQVKRVDRNKEGGSFLKMLPVGHVIAKTHCWKQIIYYSSLTERAAASEIMKMQNYMVLILWYLHLILFNDISCLIMP